MPELLKEQIERRNKICLFQLYLIQVSLYQRQLTNNFKLFGCCFESKRHKIEDMLDANPWLANSTSKVLDNDDWQQLKALPELNKIGASYKDKYIKLIKGRYFPLHLVILLKNYSLAKILIKRYGASVGAYDVTSDTTILDDIAKGQIEIRDLELMQLLTDTRKNRKPFGLIVGCGHSFHAVGVNHDSHAHLHSYEDFFTVDPYREAKADFQCSMQDLPKEFLRKYRGRLKYVVFEYVSDNFLIPEPLTGHSKSLDIAYDLLAPDGICIIVAGNINGYNKALLAQISGFKYGLYFPVPVEKLSTLFVKKDPRPIVISNNIKDLVAYVVKHTSVYLNDLDVHSLEVQAIGSLRLVEPKTNPVALTFSYINSHDQKVTAQNKCRHKKLAPTPHPMEHPNALIIKDYFSRLTPG
jgi:hypothetical protein